MNDKNELDGTADMYEGGQFLRHKFGNTRIDWKGKEHDEAKNSVLKMDLKKVHSQIKEELDKTNYIIANLKEIHVKEVDNVKKVKWW